MSFNELAKDWDNEKNILRSKEIGEEIKRLIGDKKHDTAMDFGAGVGLVSFYLKDYFKDILLVDSSEGMIEEANKKIRENNFENIKTCSDNILNFNEDKNFDVIYAPLVLHHIENYKEVIMKLKELLEDGGSLIIMDVPKDKGEFHKSSTVKPAHEGLEPENLKIFLKEIGFDSVTEPVEFFEGSREKDGNTIHFKLFSISATTK